MNRRSETTFEHQACIYGSDGQFREMALPFLEAGLSNGEPVLAVTTPANLELISSALGARSGEVDYAESAFFGRRPQQRVAAFHRYWRRHADESEGDGTRVRVLAEPVWAGRSAREVAAWTRMESALNVALAGTSVFMICPYDTRATAPEIVAAARRTHPVLADGPHASPSPDYADPAGFAGEWEAGPLPEPPVGAQVFEFDGDLRGLRRFITSRAAAHGLAGERVGLLVQAAGEVGTFLKNQAPGSAAVRTWEHADAVVCDFRQPGGSLSDPFLGLRPAELDPRPGDGLWLSGQICDWIDIRSDADGPTIRLQVPGRRNAEAAEQGIRYPA
ncbi:MAG: sensor histidine kinase [Streptosporangiaceae bacterium]